MDLLILAIMENPWGGVILGAWCVGGLLLIAWCLDPNRKGR